MMSPVQAPQPVDVWKGPLPPARALPALPTPESVPVAPAPPPSRPNASTYRTARALGPLLMLLIALNLGRLNGLTPALANLPIGKVFLPLCWLLVLTGPSPQRLLQALRVTQARMFGVLFCAMVASVAFSLYPGGSFDALRTFVQGTLPFVLLVAVACSDERLLYAAGRTMVLTGALLGLAIFTGFAKSVEGRMYLGETYDPNDIALVGVIILPVAVWLMQERGIARRCLALAGAAGSLTIIVASASRGGMLGLGAVLGLMWVRNRGRLSLRWKLLAIVLLGVGLSLAPSTFWTRLQTLKSPEEDYNTSSLTGREAIWTRGLNYFAARPLTGVGLDEFGFAEGTLGSRYIPSGARIRWSAPHSIWIQILVELGIFGMLGYLGLFLPTLRDVRQLRVRCRRGRAPPERLRLLGFGEALGIAIIGFFVSGTFLAMAYSPPAMLLAGLGMAFAHVATRQRQPTGTSPRVQRAPVKR